MQVLQPKTGRKNSRGFALLIGVLVASILVSITYVMFSITLKQVSLSTTGKNSQTALYSADTGLECALFAKYQIVYQFATPIVDQNTGEITSFSSGERQTFKCNDIEITSAHMIEDLNGEIVISGQHFNALITNFYVHSPSPDKSCSFVTVSTYIDDGDFGGKVLKQKIESRGYNTCPVDVSGNAINDPQRVERGLEVYD